MIDLKDAYKIAEKAFEENEDYTGIAEVRETNANWIFRGKLKQATYGTFDINVPKTGDEPYLENPYDESYSDVWANAKRVSI